MLARLGSGLALAAVAALALVGCSPPEPVATTPAAEPTVEPSASSTAEEQLLADATEVAEEFVTYVDEGFATGTLPAEQISDTATPELIEQLEAEIEAFASQGLRTTGASRIDTPSLVNASPPLNDGDTFLLLTCFDTSAVTTFDADDQPVSGGVERQPRMFEFEFAGGARHAQRPT